MSKTCELCEREVALTTRHHLIPRTVHRKSWFKKRFTKEQMHTTVDLCKMCHRNIHKLIPDEKEMAREYNTLDKLLEHEKVAKFVKWLRKRG